MDTRRFNFEQSAVRVRLNLAKFLHMLPLPGTLVFPFLRDSLLEFGLLPKAVSYETPASRLTDAALTLGLFDETVTVRIFVDHVEVSINKDYRGTVVQISLMVVRLVEILERVDPDTAVAGMDVLVRAHITLPGSDADAHLKEFFLPQRGATPDAFAFRILPDAQLLAKNGRVTIGKSLLIPDGLFIEWNASFVDFPDLKAITLGAAGEFGQVLSLFGLVANEEQVAA